jgi:outer membrane protein
MKTKTPINNLLKFHTFGLRASFLVTLVFTSSTNAQTLEDYVREGLKSNLAAQQKNISVQQAQQSLKIAQTYFLPSVTLLADYTSGDGGRSISFPVGDLLNPVYASLNQMTKSDAFPQIENVKQNFLPKNFYDARIRTSVPLVNTDIYMNRSIQSQQIMVRQYELEAYKRQLVQDIKTAYFNYQSAVIAVKIYESAVDLVNKNVAINESLLKNGKSLPANYLRSKSEAERVKAELNSARNRVSNAKKYFNFLLNKDLDATIDISAPLENNLADSTFSTSVREEIQIVKAVREINRTSLQMSKLSRLPKMNAFLDLGSQAYNFKYNENSRYYLFGVQFSMPLFQGLRTHQLIRQNTLEVKRTESQVDAVTKQFELSVQLAQNDLQTSTQNYLAVREQVKSAKSYFNLIDKGYQQGVNSLIEFLDARNQLTSSQLQENLKMFEMLTASAKLERETASYSFEN